MRAALAIIPLALAACAGGIPTPQSAGLPEPEAILIPNPAALPDAQLCAYADEVGAALAAWEGYLSRWTVALGKKPVSLAALVGEREEIAKLVEARGALCVVPPERPAG